MPTRLTRQRDGFSMIELLVTITIAGIAFVALVPVFVSAMKKVSGDTYRNVATQMAQDRIELIRQLDYDQINNANLNNADFPTVGAQLFSPTVPYYGGGTTPMTFHVLTQVALVPSTATLGGEQFKTVTVIAWWGPQADLTKIGPSVKPTRLQTQVYKQYAGPTVLTFTAATLVPMPAYGADLVWIKAMPLTLQATIASLDRPETAMVHFTIRDASSEVEFMDVVTAAPEGTYTWTYAGPLADGLYTVYAQARSTKNFAGNLAPLPLTVEQGPPAKPLNVQAVAGVNSVTVTWGASTAADFDHFEVFRSDNGSAGAYLYRGSTVGNVSPSYVDADASLQIGQTYYYIVYPVDQMGTALEAKGIMTYRGLPSDPAGVSMVDLTDKNPPPVPAWVGAPFSPGGLAVTVVWTKTIDAAPPAVPSGTKEFIVTRQSSSDAGVTWGSQIQLPPVTFDPAPLVTTQSVSDNTLTYGMKYRYAVLARDVAGNSSADAAWTIVTVPPQTRTLKVINSSMGQARYVYITSLNDAVYYNQSGAVVASAALARVTIPKKESRDWTLILADYRVHYSTTITVPFPVANVLPAPNGTSSVTVP